MEKIENEIRSFGAKRKIERDKVIIVKQILEKLLKNKKDQFSVFIKEKKIVIEAKNKSLENEIFLNKEQLLEDFRKNLEVEDLIIKRNKSRIS